MSGDWLNRYRGARARSYDAERCHTLRWAREQVAINNFVTLGPVLDVPLGTGRYCDIYREKGLGVIGIDISPDMLAVAKEKYPDLDARQGDIFKLPFPDQTFGTVVCTRMLDWFGPEDMQRIITELRRVAKELVVSIRYGEEKWRINQTHDLTKYYRAIDGLHITDRVITEVGGDGIEEILHLRPPCWGDVLEQFAWHGFTPAFEVQRLAAYWFQDIQLYREDSAQPKHVNVKAEYVPVADLAKIIDEMGAEYDYDLPDDRCYVTKEPPRFWEEGPATICSHGGRTVVLDGRRRINKWRGKKGPYVRPVLHIYSDHRAR